VRALAERRANSGEEHLSSYEGARRSIGEDEGELPEPGSLRHSAWGPLHSSGTDRAAIPGLSSGRAIENKPLIGDKKQTLTCGWVCVAVEAEFVDFSCVKNPLALPELIPDQRRARPEIGFQLLPRSFAVHIHDTTEVDSPVLSQVELLDSCLTPVHEENDQLE
jgi:hypothetical protein